MSYATYGSYNPLWDGTILTNCLGSPPDMMQEAIKGDTGDVHQPSAHPPPFENSQLATIQSEDINMASERCHWRVLHLRAPPRKRKESPILLPWLERYRPNFFPRGCGGLTNVPLIVSCTITDGIQQKSGAVGITHHISFEYRSDSPVKKCSKSLYNEMYGVSSMSPNYSRNGKYGYCKHCRAACPFAVM